jgi:hypothetical protein
MSKGSTSKYIATEDLLDIVQKYYMGPKKTRTILFRCTEAEYVAIHHAARAERRTLSGFLLTAALDRTNASPADNASKEQETATSREE